MSKRGADGRFQSDREWKPGRDVVTGLRETVDALSGLEDDIRTKAIRSGVGAGAKVIRDDARARAPKRKGHLAASIIHKSARTRDRDVVAFNVAIKPGTNARLYAHLPEFGTGARVVDKTGREVGSMPATPYLRPAMMNNDERVVHAFSFTVKARLRKLGVM